MGSSDVDNHDTDIDTVVTNTEAYDTDAEYATAIWGAAISGYTGEATFGGELQSLDPNITLILADTSAFDTAGEYASAIWDAALSSYTGEATFGGELQQLDPNLTLVLADTNELETDWKDGGRLDLLMDQIKAMTDLIAIVTTTVSDANDANSFTLTAGIDVNDAFWLNVIMVEDATDGHKEIRYIEDWLSTRVLVVDETLGFTPDAGDNVWILSGGYGGYLYDILYRLKLSSIPVYHYNNTTDGSGGTSGAGGTTYFDSSGTDP